VIYQHLAINQQQTSGDRIIFVGSY